MYCSKCGAVVQNTEKFCGSCGAAVVSVDMPSAQPVQIPPTPQTQQAIQTPGASPVTQPMFNAGEAAVPVVQKPAKKNKGKVILIVSLISAAVIAAITTVVLLIVFGGSNKKDGYIDEVKNYLDYIANKKDDANGYISSAYLGGNFGSCIGGDAGLDIHKTVFKSMFKNKDLLMGYGYGEYERADTWDEYIENALISDFYQMMKSNYGSWKMSYEIVGTKQLSGTKLSNLEDVPYDLADSYRDLRSEISDKDVRKKITDFIATFENEEITTAYSVKVRVKIDGSRDYYDENVEFIVAKIGKDWVIVNGPSFYHFAPVFIYNNF